MDAYDGPSGPDDAGGGADEYGAPPMTVRIELMHEVQRHIEATLDDLAGSVRRERPITLPNLGRLFARRWALATRGPDPSASRNYRIGLDYGRSLLAESYGRVRFGAGGAGVTAGPFEWVRTVGTIP